MFAPEMYQLLDFGQGRRLERFGSILLDRPCPGCERQPQGNPAAWEAAHARFERTTPDAGRWTQRQPLAERWTVCHGPIVLELKRTDFGHLGVFPEQANHWDWIAGEVARAGRPLRVLNLFAYTGGSTLAAAAAGAEVVHVDSARNIVAWARRNAELSGLAGAAIRWIIEDARKFVRRELQRGAAYDAVILDPPSYGHGRRGEVWRLSTRLGPLLADCGRLTAGRRQFMLLTCHTPGYGPQRLADLLRDAWSQAEPGRISAEAVTIPAATGRQLPSGVAARWSA
jgi:23S rRNA (cytosine1962-C5)-methyltransferase